MEQRSIGIVGYGSFGALLHTLVARFAPSIQVRIHSSRFPTDGKTFFSLEDTAAADAVIVAVPIHAFELTLKKIVPLIRPDTIIIDVATVKGHTTRLLRRLCKGRAYVAMHPMWGPESYEKKQHDIHGFRIVVAEQTIGDLRYAVLKRFLGSIGFDVVEMSAAEHDKHLAETLFLTHFVAQVISRGKFNRTAIDTVSFGYLMDAVESVKHDTGLFKDVYRFVPYCKKVLARFAVSEKAVQKILSA